MKIQVFWKGKLFFQADAEEEYNFHVPFFSSIERKSIPLKERADKLHKISNLFVREVMSHLRLMNINDKQIYLVFPSRSNDWGADEIENWDGDFPGKI
jgi:hypothetical protein